VWHSACWQRFCRAVRWWLIWRCGMVY
jgi:hypothetical protein